MGAPPITTAKGSSFQKTWEHSNPLTLLMTEETHRSHKLWLATPCARSIVNELNKVWLDGATTSEPRHLRRRPELYRCSFGKPIYATPGLLDFEITATAINRGRKKDETDRSHSASNMSEIETRDGKNRR
jgi:hypothetical protein